MRRTSPKAAARQERSAAGREAIRARIPGCEYCGVPGFALHEIPRAGIRSYILDNAAVILGLCDPGCHQSVAEWPKARQLALLKFRRPADYNLAEFNRWAIAMVTDEDVEGYMDELISELTRE